MIHIKTISFSKIPAARKERINIILTMALEVKKDIIGGKEYPDDIQDSYFADSEDNTDSEAEFDMDDFLFDSDLFKNINLKND
uniref:Phage protein n=1 Tax=Parastrongyloides trichosuri TaxID=131310 RepID=A0A0N4Z8R1_PARTI